MKTIFLALLFSVSLQAATMVTDDLMKAAAKAVELGGKHGISKTLVVYDLDNTLLAMDRDLGSDQWFAWQEDEVTRHTPLAVASDFSGLLTAQGILFDKFHMHPTQKNAAAVVASLASNGFPSIVLSARGPEFRKAAERELARNGFHFDEWAMAPKEGYTEDYTPNAGGRLVSYRAGIYMVSGQHKGAMLSALLEKTKNQFKALLFVDDQQIHVTRMEESFGKSGLDLVTVRYSHEDDRVAKFKASDKKEVAEEWRAIAKKTPAAKH